VPAETSGAAADLTNAAPSSDNSCMATVERSNTSAYWVLTGMRPVQMNSSHETASMKNTPAENSMSSELTQKEETVYGVQNASRRSISKNGAVFCSADLFLTVLFLRYITATRAAMRTSTQRYIM
jgi:hypothetical protein